VLSLSGQDVAVASLGQDLVDVADLTIISPLSTPAGEQFLVMPRLSIR
jgi:hypothetical protein